MSSPNVPMSPSLHERPRKRAKIQHPVSVEPSFGINSPSESSQDQPCIDSKAFQRFMESHQDQKPADLGPYCGDEVVCYGMLQFSSSPNEAIRNQQGTRPVRVAERNQLRSTGSNELLATITSQEADLLELFYEESVEVELKLAAHKPCHTLPVQFILQVILYGERNIGDLLKDVLGGLGLFLQDPSNALRDVIYWNPQRFYNEPGARAWQREPETDHDRTVHTEHLNIIDTLKDFNSDIELAETTPPTSLATSLQSHQKQALSFLLSREKGWQLGSGDDIWAYDNAQEQYINQVDGSSQDEPPPGFRGGILADAMGLGKSLAMIALIAYDKANCLDQQRYDSIQLVHGAARTRTTLIVVPSSLLDSWEGELTRHSHHGSLTWGRHDRRRKFTCPTQFQNRDIVLVSYPTLLSDWKRKRNSGILFSMIWRRVILDEAHAIKNPVTATTEAVLELQAERRWAVTASPIQNRLSELQSLLHFLRAWPYSDKNIFQSHISDLWAAGEESKSIERLKRLLSSLMLRRSGSNALLKERTDLKMVLKFGEKELQNYRTIQGQAIAQIDDILASRGSRKSYMNALQKINDLRSACNHGIQVTEPETEAFNTDYDTWDEKFATEALQRFPSMGLVTACTNCNSLLVKDFESPEEVLGMHLTQCLRLYCAECYQGMQSTSATKQFCPCEVQCAIVAVELPSTGTSIFCSPTQLDHPRKLAALIEDLRGCPNGTKSIVFSGWNLTLDMAKEALAATGLGSLQVDGRVKQKERTRLLDEFQSSDSIQVLLLSLSCGAVGLTLTAASRVYLMEPQWNPALEEQALARIHRIGQRRPVTTIRFVIEKTIEEYILTVQDGKKDLIAALLSPSAAIGISMQRLRELRDLL